MYKFLWIICLMAVSCPLLYSDDAEANATVKEALILEEKGDYFKAAELYEKADFLADERQLKVNALKSAVMCYRNANLLGKEFELSAKLLDRYPNQVKYNNLISRQYAIAKSYSQGYRDPEFWSLRWIPWLKGQDKTIEMYKSILKRAPFAKEAASGRLQLAFALNDEAKIEEAVKELRVLLRDYPDAPERKYAYLALGGLLSHLAEHGDGDSRFSREAQVVFHEYSAEYPDTPEQEFVDKAALKSKDVQAERLLGISKYYERIGRGDASQRYLNLILRDYPDTAAAAESEKRLVKLDDTYIPDGFREELIPRLPTYEKRSIPTEESNLMIVPENSNGRYLLPIYDISTKQAPIKDSKEEVVDETI